MESHSLLVTHFVNSHTSVSLCCISILRFVSSPLIVYFFKEEDHRRIFFLPFLYFFLHDVRSVVFLAQEVSCAGHKGLLPLLRIVPDLGREAEDSHAVPGIDLGLPQRAQPYLAVLACRVVDARALAETAVACGGRPAVSGVVSLALVLLVLVLFILLEAGVAEVLVVPVATVAGRGTVLSARGREAAVAVSGARGARAILACDSAARGGGEGAGGVSGKKAQKSGIPSSCTCAFSTN